MQKNLTLKTLAIVAILIVFVYGIFGIPKGFSGDALKESLLSRISLGLDLKGGTHMILQVMVKDAVKAESDRAAELLREELKKANVSFGDIATLDDSKHPEQVVVKGINPDAVGKLRDTVTEKLAGYDLSGGADNTYTLTMKSSALNDLQERTVEQSIEAIRNRVDTLGVSEPLIERHGLGQDQILVQLPGVDDPTRVKSIIQSTARLEFREALNHGTPYPSEQAALDAKVPVVTGTDLRDARESRKGDTNAPVVSFNLSAAAGRKFSEFTREHAEGGPNPSNLAIVLDNKVISAPSIRSEISDSGEIEGGFTEQSARDLAMLLRSGALPASLHYLEERTVGPSLGAASIRAGVRAAVFGMLAVMIFMLIYYRGAGINADLALILNLVILLGFLGFTGATLTLPGIAGVILTVGMGVDSNVLIFERIREELRHGKAPSAAVDQGFGRAWLTIIDTHVTTIVSAFILFLFGSGPVKGFAVTLTFGLLANLFTAVFVSRVIFDAILTRKQRGEALSI